MARKKIKEKVSRKDDLDPRKDKFIEKSTSLMDWAMARRRQLAALMAAALLAAVAGILISRVLESRRVTASQALEEVLASAMAPVVPIDEELGLSPAGDDGLVTFPSRLARAEATIDHMAELERTQGGTAIGVAGRLLEAGARFDAGEYEASIAAYEAFLSEAGGDLEWLRPNALEGLGLALEAAGRLDEARSRFQELGRASTGRTALAAEYNEARIARALGDNTAAVELLRRVIARIVESDYDRLDYLFIQAGGLLRTLDPEADVPSLPGGGMMEGFDPALIEQYLKAQQAAGGGPR